MAELIGHEMKTKKLTRKDIREAAATLGDQEARFLVDYYYIIQEDRKRFRSQERAMQNEPSKLISFLGDTSEDIESLIKKALDDYTSAHPIGRWMKEIYGIGPCIAAGLLAYIKIERAPTAGHIWSFAGIDPSVKWEKGQKRPFCAELKKICFYAGDSFRKFSGKDECYYGQLYKQRKEFEIKRNESGYNKEVALELAKKFGDKTEAKKYLLSGVLPPAQIDARARRWAVKIFLSHLHQVWYEWHYGVPAPVPFVIAHKGHVHIIPPTHAVK